MITYGRYPVINPTPETCWARNTMETIVVLLKFEPLKQSRYEASSFSKVFSFSIAVSNIVIWFSGLKPGPLNFKSECAACSRFPFIINHEGDSGSKNIPNTIISPGGANWVKRRALHAQSFLICDVPYPTIAHSHWPMTIMLFCVLD